MKPISEVKLLDCMEGMRQYPDKYFELAIVDPPYGIGEDGRTNHTRGLKCKSNNYSNRERYDNEPPSIEFFNELLRVSKNQIIWGANHFISRIPYDSPAWIVWDKDNGATDFADCELAWTSFDCAVRKIKLKWQGMLQHNMKNKEVRIHPNQKPVKLYEWTLYNYAKIGDKILDTHLGSGSHRIAAYKMGFAFYAFEKARSYYEDQERRFKEAIAMPLFDAQPIAQQAVMQL